MPRRKLYHIRMISCRRLGRRDDPVSRQQERHIRDPQLLRLYTHQNNDRPPRQQGQDSLEVRRLVRTNKQDIDVRIS